LNQKYLYSNYNKVYIHYPVNDGYNEQFCWNNVEPNSTENSDYVFAPKWQNRINDNGTTSIVGISMFDRMIFDFD